MLRFIFLPNIFLSSSCLTALVALALGSIPSTACCPASAAGKPVVNADQTVIMIWDAEKKVQHFIRQASFKAEADDFGFLVPTPSQPELEESGNEAFAKLAKITAPKVQTVRRPSGGVGCACAAEPKSVGPPPTKTVKVLEEKLVAGFNAVVLETDSADALVEWLKEHGYAYSPAIAEWARPYIEQQWKITALKVAKDDKADDKQADDKSVSASALRISFATERPLFPYREPAMQDDAKSLGAQSRLLRIYFLAEARYDGELTKDQPWTGKVAWAGEVRGEDRSAILQELDVQKDTGPADWWLTEFEDPWPYQPAPADLYFSPAVVQDPVERQPIIRYVSSPLPSDATFYTIIAVVGLPPLLLRMRGARKR